MPPSLLDRATEILRENDLGKYTVPTRGLYPFQWNWDSCLSALGLARLDEARAWSEIQTLFAHQWEDGMIPHIVFHEKDDGYFPGPEVWGTRRPVPTSGLTQPPVAGFCIRRLYERAESKELAEEHVLSLLPRAARWHDWLYRCRDPQGTGLVAILHPWESGRDNSIDWDTALERVPTEGVAPFERRDTRHADPAHRPTQAQYERYIWLVQHFRSLGWSNVLLHDASPFRVVDPGFNAILLRSGRDIAELAEELGMDEIAERIGERTGKGLDAMESLWSEEHGQYLCLDRETDSLIPALSSGGLLPAFAPIPRRRTEAIASRLTALGERVRYLVPSHDPDSPGFDSRRYWRGPVWLIVNYMLCDGLERADQKALADRIASDSLELIEKSGFPEYYDPLDGEPCGGDRFTWTAAMAMEFLARRR